MKKLIVIGIIILLFVGTNITSSAISQSNPSNILLNSVKTIIVDNEGDGDYRSIQEAINCAVQDDIIQVYSGTYYEKITINKTLILEGMSSEYETGDDSGKPVIIYYEPSPVVTLQIGNCRIKGFSIISNVSNENNIGIQLVHAPYTNISENNITNCYRGIDFTADFLTQNCSIFKNNFSYCEQGFRISNKNHIVKGNKVVQCRFGLNLFVARNCKVYNNIFIGKKITDVGNGIYSRSSVNISIYYNHIENFSCGLYIDEINCGAIVMHPLSGLKQFDIRKETGNLHTLEIPRSLNKSLSRALNIHHNNFINNTDNALVHYFRFPLYVHFILCLFNIGFLIQHQAFLYPRPLVLQIHFYKNYWDDKPITDTIYKIDTYWMRLGWLFFIFIFILSMCFPWGLPNFTLNGLPLHIIDFHPLNEPYNIEG